MFTTVRMVATEPFIFLKIIIKDNSYAIEDKMLRLVDSKKQQEEIYYHDFYYDVAKNTL